MLWIAPEQVAAAKTKPKKVTKQVSRNGAKNEQQSGAKEKSRATESQLFYEDMQHASTRCQLILQETS